MTELNILDEEIVGNANELSNCATSTSLMCSKSPHLIMVVLLTTGIPTDTINLYLGSGLHVFHRALILKLSPQRHKRREQRTEQGQEPEDR